MQCISSLRSFPIVPLLLSLLIVTPYASSQTNDVRDKRFLEALAAQQFKGRAVSGELLVRFKSRPVTGHNNSNASAEKSNLQSLTERLDLADEVLELKPIFPSKSHTAAKGSSLASADQATKGSSPLADIYLLRLTGTNDPVDVIERLKRNGAISWVEPNYLLKTQLVPNDPFFSSSNSWSQGIDDLWGLKKISAPAAWDITQGAGVKVAVIDTGVDYNHPDIAPNMWSNPNEIPNNSIDDDGNGYVDDMNGFDFTTCAQFGPLGCDIAKSRDNDAMDDNGHGTHVAGTIAAVGNNNIGIIGVAPQAKIIAMKVLSAQGAGSNADIALAVAYAADTGADVINASLGGEGYSFLLRDVFQYAKDKGVVSIVAAGNSNLDVERFTPASLDSVIAVSSSDENDAKSNFSNFTKQTTYGPLRPVNLAIAAPGGGSGSMQGDTSGQHTYINILSLQAQNTDLYDGAPNYTPGDFIIRDNVTPNGAAYYRARGTSMACPHVAGAAALLLSEMYRKNPTLRSDPALKTAAWNEVYSRLVLGADPLSSQATDENGAPVSLGFGRLNALKSLNLSPQPFLRIDNDFLVEAVGNANRVIDAGEEGDLSFQISNLWHAADNVELSIVSSNPSLLEILTPSVNLGPLAGNSNAKTDGSPIAVRAGNFRFVQPVDLLITARMSTGGAVVEQVLKAKVFLGALKVTNSALPASSITPEDYIPPLLPQAYPYTPDFSAALEGDRILWSEYQNGVANIILYDLNTNSKTLLSSGGNANANKINPSIFGDTVVWQDDALFDWDIHLYSLSNGALQTISLPSSIARNDQVQPRISGDRIVWTDTGPINPPSGSSAPNSDVYLYNLVNRQLLALSNDSGQQQNIAVNGQSAAWEDRNNAAVQIVPSLSVPSRKLDVFPLTSFAFHPQIHGSRLIASALDLTGGVDLYQVTLDVAQANASLPQALTTDGHLKIFPQISDSKAVWQDGRGTQWEIFAKDLQSGVIEQVTLGIPRVAAPTISGRNLIWVSDTIVWYSDLEGGAAIPGRPPVSRFGPQTVPLQLSLQGRLVAKKKLLSFKLSALNRDNGQAITALEAGCKYRLFTKLSVEKQKKAGVKKVSEKDMLTPEVVFELKNVSSPAYGAGFKKLEMLASLACPSQDEVFSNSLKIKFDKISGVPLKAWEKAFKRALKKAGR